MWDNKIHKSQKLSAFTGMKYPYFYQTIKLEYRWNNTIVNKRIGHCGPFVLVCSRKTFLGIS